MRKLAGLIPIFLFFCASQAAAQQPVDNVLDHGSIGIYHLTFPSALFDFGGPNLRLGGYVVPDDVGFFPTCSPCVAGEVIHLSGSLVGETLTTVTLNGNTRDIWVFYVLSPDAGMLTIPNRSAFGLGIRYTLPATVTGTLTGYNRNPFVGDPGPPVFTLPINMHGTATVFLWFRGFNFFNNAEYGIETLTFNVQPDSFAKGH